METSPRARDHDVTDETVLVTGGAGFVGSHLVEALAEANDVRVLDTADPGEAPLPDGVEYVQGDVRTKRDVRRAMDGVDLVYHQAGLVSVEESVRDPRESNDVNVGGSVAVLDAARREEARVVVASSAAIYGSPSSVPITEGEPPEPDSPYGIDKLAVDHYARRFEDLYDLPTVVLRYFNVYGPRQSAADYSGVVSTFLRQARTDSSLTVHGDGSQTRDFVHVADVVRANLLAATTSHVGRAYNVGTGEAISIMDLARTIRGVADSSSPIVTVEAREGDVERSHASIERARRELEYEPRVGLQAGLRQLVAERNRRPDAVQSD